jgi:transcriptional regulator with XRE-family HTH domain
MKSTSPDIVGKYIRVTRHKRGYRQKELAELAQMPQSLLSQIESGVRRGSTIQLDAARRLALVLGVSLDALAGLTKTQEEDDGELLPSGLVKALQTA